MTNLNILNQPFSNSKGYDEAVVTKLFLHISSANPGFKKEPELNESGNHPILYI